MRCDPGHSSKPDRPKSHKIRANTALLGVIEAGMFLELTKQGVLDAHWVAEVHKNLALKRCGKPEEIGHACVFLASERAAYLISPPERTPNFHGG
jgi:NAD(P)-dependent dehydrogenase (short-subunit alcohol dehydrogenase family)